MTVNQQIAARERVERIAGRRGLTVHVDADGVIELDAGSGRWFMEENSALAFASNWSEAERLARNITIEADPRG